MLKPLPSLLASASPAAPLGPDAGRTPSVALPSGRGWGRKGVGEPREEEGRGRRQPRTTAPFPVRTPRLVPNLPLPASFRPGKALDRGSQVCWPRGTQGHTASAETLRPEGRPTGPGTAKGLVCKPATGGRASPCLASVPCRSFPSQWRLRSFRPVLVLSLSVWACELHRPGGVLLPSLPLSFLFILSL